MRRQIAASLLITTLLACPASAEVLPAGTLRCTIGAGVSVGLGAYRDVTCVYERSDLPSEYYEGFTGIITTDTAASQVISFAVISPEPYALAALGGDFDQNLFGSPDITHPAVNSLLGGRYRRIILQAVDNRATTNLAFLGYAVGVTPLHLNYAGASSRRGSGSAVRRARRGRVPTTSGDPS